MVLSKFPTVDRAFELNKIRNINKRRSNLLKTSVAEGWSMCRGGTKTLG